MATNPLLSVRIPSELNELLPKERGARSRFVVQTLREKLVLAQAEDELAALRRRVEVLEQWVSGQR